MTPKRTSAVLTAPAAAFWLPAFPVRGKISRGLYDEVRRLFDKGYTPRDPGLRAIGYREFFVQDEAGYRLSRDIAGRYAKRQITFFASLPGAQWIEAGRDDAETAEKIFQFFTFD